MYHSLLSVANPTCVAKTFSKVLTGVLLEVLVEDGASDDATKQSEKGASLHFEGSPTFLMRPLKRFLAAEEQ